MLSIYKYTDASGFLKDAWKEKKTRNSAFSMRSWAKSLGFENNAPLSLMLAGKRPIPQKYIPLFIKSLDLSAKEGLYLEALIALSKVKKVEQRGFYLDRMKSLYPQQTPQVYEVESYKALGNPIHALILEMTELPDFRPDPNWMKDRMIFKVTVTEIEEAIERLIGLGLLKEDADGKLTKTHQVLTNRPDIKDAGSQEYHRRVSALAAQALAQSVTQREFNSYSMNIKKSDIPGVKTSIREFTKTFINTFAIDSTADETYQLNVQFFGLTQQKEEKK